MYIFLQPEPQNKLLAGRQCLTKQLKVPCAYAESTEQWKTIIV